MVLEVAEIQIRAGEQQAFEAAVSHGVQTVISQSKGYRGYRLERGIESPQRYLLLIEWDTLENHTVDFRQSPNFAQWRAIVGPYFVEPPRVEHFAQASGSLG